MKHLQTFRISEESCMKPGIKGHSPESVASSCSGASLVLAVMEELVPLAPVCHWLSV